MPSGGNLTWHPPFSGESFHFSVYKISMYTIFPFHLFFIMVYLNTTKRRKCIMVELITNVNSAVNGFVWGIPMLVLLVGTGILMTALTKFFQLSHI